MSQYYISDVGGFICDIPSSICLQSLAENCSEFIQNNISWDKEGVSSAFIRLGMRDASVAILRATLPLRLMSVCFDPNQPRDAKGQWTDGGGGVSPNAPTSGGDSTTTLGGYLQTLPETDRARAEAFIKDWSDEGYKSIRAHQLNPNATRTALQKKGVEDVEGAFNKIQGDIDFAHNVLVNAPQHSGTKYRGLSFDNGKQAKSFINKHAVPGEVMEHTTFSSYSSSKSIAERFSKSKGTQRVILMYKGKVGVDISTHAVTRLKNEKEVLIPKGTRAKVVSVKQVGDSEYGRTWYVHMEAA